MTSDPEIIRYMSSARHRHDKSSWYAALKVDPYLPGVFAETNAVKHDQLRVKLAPAVSGPCQSQSLGRGQKLIRLRI